MSDTFAVDQIDIGNEMGVLHWLEERSLEHRRNKRDRSTPPQDLKIKPVRPPDPKTIPPRHVSILENAQRDLVESTIRLLAREIGWMLYCRGGTDLMRRANPSAALNSWWDGIGVPNDKRGYWL